MTLRLHELSPEAQKVPFKVDAYAFRSSGGWNSQTDFEPVRVVRTGKAAIVVATRYGKEISFNLPTDYDSDIRGMKVREIRPTDELRERGEKYRGWKLSFDIAKMAGEHNAERVRRDLEKRLRIAMVTLEAVISQFRHQSSPDQAHVEAIEAAIKLMPIHEAKP